MAASSALIEMQVMIICFDLLAYTAFVGLAIWGIRVGRCGSGIYSVFFFLCDLDFLGNFYFLKL